MTGWTVQKTLNWSIARLQECKCPEPEISVTQLLASALDLSWSHGYRDLQSPDEALQQRVMSAKEANIYQDYLSRRSLHQEPLQYILGQWDFLDWVFKIRPPLLCPRPETEELVLKVADDILQQNKTTLRVLDVGCGTGVIGISLAAMISNIQVTAIDVEPIAVETSLNNARAILGKDHTAYQAMQCAASEFRSSKKFDVVVSNPPYIPQADMDSLDKNVVDHESHDALCGGMDGMDVIRDILRLAPQWSTPGAVVWMEVDPSHPRMIQELVKDSTSIRFDSVHQDLYGRDRFVKLDVL